MRIVRRNRRLRVVLLMALALLEIGWTDYSLAQRTFSDAEIDGLFSQDVFLVVECNSNLDSKIKSAISREFTDFDDIHVVATASEADYSIAVSCVEVRVGSNQTLSGYSYLILIFSDLYTSDTEDIMKRYGDEVAAVAKVLFSKAINLEVNKIGISPPQPAVKNISESVVSIFDTEIMFKKRGTRRKFQNLGKENKD